jgi:hypothetical protein
MEGDGVGIEGGIFFPKTNQKPKFILQVALTGQRSLELSKS